MNDFSGLFDDLETFIDAGIDEDPSEVDIRTEEQKKEYHKKMDEIGERMLLSMKELTEDGDKLFGEAKKIELETRQMNVSLPPSAWAALDNIKELFQNFKELGSETDLPPQFRGLQRLLEEKFNTQNIEEVFMSQNFFEAIFNFCGSISQIEIIKRMEDAAATGDPETLKRTIDFITQAVGGNIILEDE